MAMLDTLWMFLKRGIWGAIFLFLVTPIFLAVWVPIAAVIAIVDWLLSLVDVDLIKSTSNPLWTAFEWWMMQFWYTLTGKGEQDILPYI